MPSFTPEPLGDAPLRDVGALLGRAFAENPVARACLAHCPVEDRLRRVTALNHGLVEATRRAGTIEIVRENATLLGAQLSFAPGQWPIGIGAWLAMARGALATGWQGVLRYARYDEHVHPLHPQGPCFYLWVLGVEPSAQGRGVGSALLRALSARADAAQLPVYLETDKETSVRIYERHGFEVEKDITIGSLGGLRTWTMLRHPRE